MPRLLHRRRPGRAPRPPERARHDARVRLARAAGRHRAREGAHGLGHIPWYTITDDFDKDFGVDEWHGTNAFIRDGDRVFRTYFVDNRGDEQMGNTWTYLDITALGRQEKWEDSPEGYPQTATYEWWNWHDAYNDVRALLDWKQQVARGIAAFLDAGIIAHVAGVPSKKPCCRWGRGGRLAAAGARLARRVRCGGVLH